MRALIFAAGWILGMVVATCWNIVSRHQAEAAKPVTPEMFQGWARCGYCQGLYTPASSDAKETKAYCCQWCEETAFMEKIFSVEA